MLLRASLPLDAPYNAVMAWGWLLIGSEKNHAVSGCRHGMVLFMLSAALSIDSGLDSKDAVSY